MKKYRPNDYWYEITQRPDPNNNGRFARYYQVTCRQCGVFRLKLANSMGDDGLRKWFIAHGWEIGKSQRGHVCSRCLHEPKVAPPQAAPLEPEPELPPLPEPPANPIAEAWVAASYAERKMFLHAMRATMRATWQWVVEKDEEWSAQANAEQRRAVVGGRLSEAEIDAQAHELLGLFERFAKEPEFLKRVVGWAAENLNEREFDHLQLAAHDLKRKLEAGMAERRQSTERETSCSEVQHGSHIDSMPTQPPLPENRQPVGEHVEAVIVDKIVEDDEPADWWKEMNARMGK
jgi:hypothetical protein